MILYLSALFESFNNVLSPEQKKSKKRDLWDYYDLSQLNVLQSFAYAKPKFAEHYKECRNFLMDSGAFTLMMSKTKSQDFDIKNFAKTYGNFVRKYDVENFIELDVDCIYDIPTYIDCLHILQDSSGKDPIRVFHGWRGIDYYEELVKQKDYICLGGPARGVKVNTTFDYLDWFVAKAHENNCKIHGLAVTDPVSLRRYNFDSVDSSTWSYSTRGGCIYRFDGEGIQTYESQKLVTQSCTRVENSSLCAYGLNEWMKYSDAMMKVDSLFEKTI